jgi:hypothetical protein
MPAARGCVAGSRPKRERGNDTLGSMMDASNRVAAHQDETDLNKAHLGFTLGT